MILQTTHPASKTSPFEAASNSANANNRFSDDVAQQRAAEYHCTVEYADAHTLQLDIDTDDDFRDFEERLIMLLQLDTVPVEPEYSVRWSRGGNRHVILHLREPLPILERIAIQCFLGSDRDREMLCFAGMKKGHDNPILLYRPNSVQEIAFKGRAARYRLSDHESPF